MPELGSNRCWCSRQWTVFVLSGRQDAAKSDEMPSDFPADLAKCQFIYYICQLNLSGIQYFRLRTRPPTGSSTTVPGRHWTGISKTKTIRPHSSPPPAANVAQTTKHPQLSSNIAQIGELFITAEEEQIKCEICSDCAEDVSSYGQFPDVGNTPKLCAG